MVYYFDMDGVIANFHKEAFSFKNASSRKWISELEPFMDNINLIRNLIMNNEIVYILTKAINENAKLGKIDFLNKWIPELDTDSKFICIIGNGRKVDYKVTENGMLIDDDMKNLNPWKKAGLPIYYVKEKGAKIEF